MLLNELFSTCLFEYLENTSDLHQGALSMSEISEEDGFET